MNAVRILLSIAICFGWKLHQFDVKILSLHGILEEKVHMEILPGYDSTSEKNYAS